MSVALRKLRRVGRHYVLSRRGGVRNGSTSSSSGNGQLQSQTLDFQHYLGWRRNQAEKSILIQVKGLASCPEVREYLSSKYGPLSSIYHYSIPSKGKTGPGSSPILPQGGNLHWVLAEFEDKGDFLKALISTRSVEGMVPYGSAMTWTAGSNNSGGSKSKPKGKRKGEEEGVEDEMDLQRVGIPTEKLVGSGNVDFGHGKTLNHQLEILERSLKLSDLGIRIRFFIACQLEGAFRSLFPQGCVLPFGSTVSGIGRQSGDLDLVLLPDKKEILRTEDGKHHRQKTDDRMLQIMFQSKMSSGGNSSNARFQIQRVMETVADILQLCVPGCSHVQRILQARVPILRFWSDFTELQCDLSMTNSSGVHMSELIYIMTRLDPRFATLLFAIRSWASARKITNPVPGRQPTNFMFVMLLIYFLQQKKILPTLDVLFNNPEPHDVRTTTDGIDCTFLRKPEKIAKHFSPQCPDETVAELLFEFFEYYSEFDFNTKGVSLLTGGAWGKPDAGPLYIQNPLERHLNIARNVSKEEVSRFKSECCSALWKLETVTNSSDKKHISLQDLLLTPVYDSSSKSKQEHRIQAKELLAD